MLNIDAGPFRLSELDDAMKKLKRKKVEQKTKLQSEMLQTLGEDVKLALLDTMNGILESEQVPDKQKPDLIIRLKKISYCNR